jgi:DNA-directed RNA polymerase specialized sigma24 family protein
VLHSLAGIRHQGGALPEALNLFGEACALKRRIDQLASRSDSRVLPPCGDDTNALRGSLARGRKSAMGRDRPAKSAVIPVVVAAAGAAAIAVPLSAQASSAGGKHRRAPHRQQSGTSPALAWSAVAKALTSLHPDHRQVLVETYFLGSSVDEAAATLGMFGQS